jgi:toxin FitB
MILLDTNVVSEPMKPAPAESVRRWLDRQANDTLFVSAVTLAEMQFGLACLPTGSRRDRLTALYLGIEKIFAGRILSFDAEAARHYAELAVAARAAGKGLPLPDGYIAAIAAAHGFAVATRDSAPFEAAGIEVINPWDEAAL